MFQGGNKNMQQLMKQAQKMQKDMAKAQQDLENTIVEASAGGGMVQVEMNGKYEIISLKIDPEVVDPADVSMLEDLLLVALNDAKDKISKSSEDELGKITGGMKIPGLF